MTYCINAYKSLRYTNSGDAMLCCKSENWLDDSNGDQTNIQRQSFKEALNGKIATEIRTALDNGEDMKIVRSVGKKKMQD